MERAHLPGTNGKPETPLEGWRRALENGRAGLRTRFEARPSAPDLLRKNCVLVDELLRNVWKAYDMPAHLTLVAVGGYGRGQLFPHSDIDLLILLDRPADEALQEKLQTLVGAWWDIGLETGHSIRTVDECVELARLDITVQTNMLEPRWLAGNHTLYKSFIDATLALLEPLAFLQAKRLEQRQRHARFEATNLEPNVKERAGGLRDLNHILWITRAAGYGKSWRSLVNHGVITETEARIFKSTNVFCTRCASACTFIPVDAKTA